MDSRTYVDAQTSLIDLFLPELNHVRISNLDVNFNNTKQFDALLRYLEFSLQSLTFVLVPSTNVLHILFTLCCRCPTSNWTHMSSHLDGISASTEYMKQVNEDYDHTLNKMPILERSRRILHAYVQLIGSERETSIAVEQLYVNMENVILTFLPYSIKSFFSPRKPVKDEIVIQNSSDDHNSKSQGLPKQTVVEVISDSEESDSILEAVEPTEIALKYRQFNLPLRSVTSLSELGSKTSGLGETTLLFKNMPHLLANATPDPEENGRPPIKKAKLSVTPVKKIQVYDDFLLVKKLESTETFDIWNLLRWALDCADSASQYQKFLFNSSQTNVHWIYRTYEGFFKVFFDFVTLQYLEEYHQNRAKLYLLNRLLTLLGPKQDWYDRAVEFVFTGLGFPTNSRSHPCYYRERLLIEHDPAILVARCKTTVEFTDNDHSMELRCQIMCLLYYQIHLQSSKTDDLIKNLSQKLAEIDIESLKAFIDSFLTVRASSRIPCEVLDEFVGALVAQLLNSITNLNFDGWMHGNPIEKNVQAVTEMLKSDKLYSSISDDLTYKTFGDFSDKWTKMVYLANWQLTQVLVQLQGCDSPPKDTIYEEILKSATLANANCHRFYNEFLESRYEDADVQAEDINFTLSTQEVEQYKNANRPRFRLMVMVLKQ